MQNGVTLETSEKDLEVIFGPVRYGTIDSKPREGAYTSVKYLYSNLNDIRKYYIRLGFHLEEFLRNEYFHDFGFESFNDFCEINLGLDKSAVSRCINVYRKFNASNYVKYENGTKSVGSKMDLDDRYKEYSYSQLCEMVSMDDVQRSQVKPDMTIKQIREIKKNTSSLSDSLEQLDSLLKDKKNDPSVATSQPEEQNEGDNFSVSKFCDLKGIVRQNYIKKLSGDKLILEIFDNNGKELFRGSCYLFSKDSGFLRVRLEGSSDGIEGK